MATSFLEHEKRLLRWAPIPLLVSLAWFVWGMWRAPLITLHLILWVVIGLAYAVTLLFQLWKRWQLLTNLGFLVVIGAAGVMAGREPDWLRLSEGVSLLVICTCALALVWVMLCRWASRFDDDVEQIVGREAR